ncbi:hypothetical protein [Okeania sp. SIO1I7]|uniref:hypothetical protein n=1 Tax=Okeania sp. SIO1I7 TaxID=2607772 RepID=UPI0013F8827A|nr:hypothetical protein [Okeania sp. SIO1I7]NET27538.1 hypothetical protein [Okeania sp. SIO1I7]
MSIYTPNYIQSLQLNLSLHDPIISSRKYDFVERDDNYQRNYFQLLVYTGYIEELPCVDMPKDDFILLYGRKEHLTSIKDHAFADLVQPSNLPTIGAQVDEGFISQESFKDKDKVTKEIGNGIYSTVSFLLKCRRLSQVLAFTWINESDIDDWQKKQKQQLIKKILDGYNTIPYPQQEKVFFVNNKGEIKPIRRRIENIETDKKNSGLIIRRDSLSYNSIALSLLFSGQAYYYNTEKNKWEQICDSILSNYEIVWEHALEISWDTFYANRIDLSQAGLTPRPPYTKINIGYPPRPDDFSLTQDKIKGWVEAKEEYQENNDFPFYPQEGSAEWDNHTLKYVAPPYPYLPLSTCT